jgi:hypothetical protein
MKRIRWAMSFAVVGALMPAWAHAQSTEPGLESAPALTAPEPEGQANFGAGTAALMIGMSQFAARNGASNWTYSGVGYVSRAAGSDLLWAPVQLPNGAVIDGVDAFFNDSSAAATGRVFLTRFFGTNSFEDVASATTPAGAPGFVTVSFDTNRVVDNTGNVYVIYLDLPIDGALTAKGVRVRYHLEVSPAPATATFTDVPTTHPLHRFVEALAASGITGGCGGSNFCPDAPLTRGQMAVFLSVALGLHFGF